MKLLQCGLIQYFSEFYGIEFKLEVVSDGKVFFITFLFLYTLDRLFAEIPRIV